MDQPVIFSDIIRRRFLGVCNAVAGFLLRLGATPNQVTFCGLIGHLIAAALAYNNKMTLAGLIILVFAPLDALDGAMARLKGTPSRFGSFFDSVVDRYSELILMGGLLGYCLQTQDWLGSLAVYAAAAGSILVSYMRAKAEGLGLTARIGLLSRLERYLILLPALIFDRPMWAVWAIAILANITAIQRFFYVSREACKPQQPL